jgi:hypothetical protein
MQKYINQFIPATKRDFFRNFLPKKGTFSIIFSSKKGIFSEKFSLKKGIIP